MTPDREGKMLAEVKRVLEDAEWHGCESTETARQVIAAARPHIERAMLEEMLAKFDAPATYNNPIGQLYGAGMAAADQAWKAYFIAELAKRRGGKG